MRFVQYNNMKCFSIIYCISSSLNVLHNSSCKCWNYKKKVFGRYYRRNTYQQKRQDFSVPSLMQKTLQQEPLFLRKTRFRNIGRSRESLTRFASVRRKNLETPVFSNGDGRKLFVGIYYIFLTQFSMKNYPDSHDDCSNHTRTFNKWEICNRYFYIKRRECLL